MQRITPKKLEVIDASSSDSEESSDEGALAPVVFESRLKLLHDKFSQNHKLQLRGLVAPPVIIWQTTLHSGAGIACAVYIKFTNEVWMGTGDGSVLILSLSNNSIVEAKDKVHTRGICSMCLVEPTKTVWLASDDKTLSAWNVESRCLMAKTERLSGQVLCTVEVGGFLVAGNLLGAITAYDVEPKNGAKDYVISVVASFEIEKNKAVLAMTFTKSNYLWLGLEKGGLKVVQPLLHDAARPFVEVHSSQPHSAMVYSLLQVGEDVWSCSKDGAIKVWELQNARDFEVVTELAELIGHEGSVYQMCLCGPDVVVSVGADMFVRTWSAIHDKNGYELLSKVETPHKDSIRVILKLPSAGGYDRFLTISWEDRRAVVWSVKSSS